MPLDFDSTKKIGAIIGSGGLVVMGDDTCMVEIARFFMNFAKNESCGKCTTCREGIPEMLRLLEGITKYKGKPEDLDRLEKIANTVHTCSLCGLGKTATNPILSTLKYFRKEYEAHIVDHECPAGVCKKFVIDPELCIGCGKCKKNCAHEAISGEFKQPHVKCQHCGLCAGNCPKKAIKEV